MKDKKADILQLAEKWKSNWEPAKKIWSPFVKLREPIWCMSSSAAASEGLRGSFAMIRLSDHRIVIDLEKVHAMGIADHSLQVLAHETGHHVYTPANLHDNASLLSRISWALADIPDRAPFVANLYADLLINDMLQRSKQLDMVAVYQQVNKNISFSSLWLMLMRTYEYLWKLKRGTLATDQTLHSAKTDADASLTASLIRSYSKNWQDGAGRFTAMLYPYLMKEADFEKSRKGIVVLLDAETAGKSGGLLRGFAALDPAAMEGAVDPRAETLEDGGDESGKKDLGGLASLGLRKSHSGGEGPQQRYLEPGIYVDLLRQVNPNINEQELINNYYKEVALPHLISFPLEESENPSLYIPEGSEQWEIGDSPEEIDWLESAISSAVILPGYTTQKRLYGPDDSEKSKQKPLDVYVGIDCSGSMGNPKVRFSWPVLAATIIGLSALRAGANVMGCLSGEPGGFLETKGFISSEKELLTVLTSYLGTGYAYGVPRLKTPFGKAGKSRSHIVVVTDDDIFSMLDAEKTEPETNWQIMEEALKNAGGSGTLVLHSRPEWHQDKVSRLKGMGWNIFYVTNEPQLLDFATEFSKLNYQK